MRGKYSIKQGDSLKLPDATFTYEDGSAREVLSALMQIRAKDDKSLIGTVPTSIGGAEDNIVTSNKLLKAVTQNFPAKTLVWALDVTFADGDSEEWHNTIEVEEDWAYT